ncbi:MAG TPA: YfiR family protein [candidate division WOR-3 bacterium]|uniref:YfiR family protein n=1 Tax=candidate division WOR-3 bacterium TaxID=2052148 RepID=A0A7C0XAS1_UNCW3|nr:YfiR family protein [candidate division WOR-3 bacterium]
MRGIRNPAGVSVLITALLVGLTGLTAQEIQVPIGVQVPIFIKILAFDRSLRKKAGDEILIGVLYQHKYMRSSLAKDEIISELKKLGHLRVQGLPVRYTVIDFIDGRSLEREIDAKGIDVLYVTPLRAVDPGEIRAVTRKKKVLTFSVIPEYVEAGLSVGLSVRGEKPRIVVNLRAAEAEGAAFSSRLLRLAQTIE